MRSRAVFQHASGARVTLRTLSQDCGFSCSGLLHSPPHTGLSRPLGIQISWIKQGSCPQGTCGPTQTYICVQLQSHFNFNKGKNKVFGDSKDGGTLSGTREGSSGATEWRTQLFWVSGLTSVPQIFAQLMVKNLIIQILGQSHLGGRDGGQKWREEGSKQLWNLYTFYFVLIIEKTILKGDWGILGDLIYITALGLQRVGSLLCVHLCVPVCVHVHGCISRGWESDPGLLVLMNCPPESRPELPTLVLVICAYLWFQTSSQGPKKQRHILKNEGVVSAVASKPVLNI